MTNNAQGQKEEAAWFIAENVHLHQMYGEDDPYINHVKRVFNRVAEVSQHREFEFTARLTAILHDVCEDSDVDFDEVTEVFGIRVRNAIWHITRNKERETYFDYILRVKENPVASLVKTCDLIENLSNCYKKMGEYERIIPRYEKALAILAARDF